jgi:hypothetical protein
MEQLQSFVTAIPVVIGTVGVTVGLILGGLKLRKDLP